jgi:hydrogenase maturation factor
MTFAVPANLFEEYATPHLAYESRGNRIGLVGLGNARRPASLDLVPDAHAGDFVRVDNGFAIQRISAAEARKSYAVLQASGDWETVELDLERDEASPDSLRR